MVCPLTETWVVGSLLGQPARAGEPADCGRGAWLPAPRRDCAKEDGLLVWRLEVILRWLALSVPIISQNNTVNLQFSKQIKKYQKLPLNICFY